MAKKKSKKKSDKDALKKKKGKASSSVSKKQDLTPAGKKKKSKSGAGQKKTPKKEGKTSSKKAVVALDRSTTAAPNVVPEAAMLPPLQIPVQEPPAADLSDFEPFTHTDSLAEDSASERRTAAFEAGFDTYAPLELDYVEAPTPPVPDGWKIEVEEDMSVLMFTQAESEVLNVPLTENFLESFLPPLNQLHLSQSEAATSWQIRLPEDSGQPPVFSMMKNGAVAASLPLSEDVVEELIPALRSYDVRGVPVELKRRTRLRAWMRRHKFWSAVLLIILVPIAGYIVFAIGQQIFFLSSV